MTHTKRWSTIGLLYNVCVSYNLTIIYKVHLTLFHGIDVVKSYYNVNALFDASLKQQPLHFPAFSRYLIILIYWMYYKSKRIDEA